MSIQATSNHKTLSFKVKGTLRPEQLEARYQVNPIRDHMRAYDTVEIDLSQCKELEAGSIHWIGTLYKRCCHMDKPLIIHHAPQHIQQQFEALDIDFLLENPESKTRH